MQWPHKRKWNENRPAYSGLTAANSNLHLSEDSSPIDIIHLFLNNEIF
jgi:hypothetical protein